MYSSQWHQPPEQQADVVVQSALAMLRRNLVQPFSLTLLNVGAANFGTASDGQLKGGFCRLFGSAEVTSRAKSALLSAAKEGSPIQR
jgi:hypothetical protein